MRALATHFLGDVCRKPTQTVIDFEVASLASVTTPAADVLRTE